MVKVEDRAFGWSEPGKSRRCSYPREALTIGASLPSKSSKLGRSETTTGSVASYPAKTTTR